MSAVLFLDVDGVLNCEETFLNRQRRRRHTICRERVATLNGVVAATGCQIVMSSAWRIGLPDVRRILRGYGLKARFCRDWRTPWFHSEHPLYGPRGNEIADWLKRNGSPPYAIVDDERGMLPEQMARLVQTDFESGLTAAHAERLIALLAKPCHGTPASSHPSASGARQEGV